MAVRTDILSYGELTWVFEYQLWNLSRTVLFVDQTHILTVPR